MWMKRITVIFGISMALLLALTTLLSAVTPNQPRPAAGAPAAVPTFPPPPAIAQIDFAQRVLHPAGLYTVALPTGWQVSETLNTREGLRTVLANESAQSIVQVDVEQPTRDDDAGPFTLADLDARYNENWLAGSWREYRSWEESSRKRSADDQLLIDFTLNSGGQTFVARQQAWTDGQWLYSVRVVTPDNATDALLHLLAGVATSLQPLHALADTPFHWNAWFDPQQTHFIRYPQDWQLSDSAPGRPASFSGAGASLRIETDALQVADADAAAARTLAQHAGAELLGVQPLEQAEATGFAVTWRARDVDGDSHSGLDLLLNGPAALHVASLRFPGLADLNTEAGAAAEPELAAMMRSFRLLPALADELADANPAG